MELAARPDHGLAVVGPDAGGVDDLTGVDLELASGLGVTSPHASHPLTLPEEADGLDPVGDQCTLAVGSARELHRESCVVDLGVVVLDGASEGSRLESRHQLQCPAPREMLGLRQAVLLAETCRHRAVQPDAGTA